MTVRNTEGWLASLQITDGIADGRLLGCNRIIIGRPISSAVFRFSSISSSSESVSEKTSAGKSRTSAVR